jgi:hypothetical protein
MLGSGTSLAWLADALLRQTKLAQARDLRHEEIALYEAWLAGHASDANVRGLLSVARYRLAQTQLAMGALEQARDNAQVAAEIGDALLAADGDNIEWVDRGSLAHAIAKSSCTLDSTNRPGNRCDVPSRLPKTSPPARALWRNRAS